MIRFKDLNGKVARPNLLVKKLALSFVCPPAGKLGATG